MQPDETIHVPDTCTPVIISRAKWDGRQPDLCVVWLEPIRSPIPPLTDNLKVVH